MVVLPGLLWSAYIYLSRMTRNFTEASDYSVLGLALVVGMVGVFLLFQTPRARLLAALAYAVVAGSGMYLGYLGSLCYLGDCPPPS
jgi:multidrug transporter EmrE-like cation transporter